MTVDGRCIKEFDSINISFYKIDAALLCISMLENVDNEIKKQHRCLRSWSSEHELSDIEKLDIAKLAIQVDLIYKLTDNLTRVDTENKLSYDEILLIKFILIRFINFKLDLKNLDMNLHGKETVFDSSFYEQRYINILEV